MRTPGSSLSEISTFKPGDHLCCIYETEEEHQALLTPYLRLGLERNEKVIYIVDARTAETVMGYLRQDGFDPRPFIEKGQLVLLTVAESYLRDGVFDPERMICLLRQETDRAVAEGYGALRVTGEMSWTLEGPPGSDQLIEYESKLNRFFPGSRCLAICQYDRRRFPAGLLLQVLATHPIAVIGAEVFENNHYIPPEVLLTLDFESSTLCHWIDGLRISKKAKEVEEALNESEERFRTALENIPDVVVIYDRDLRIRYINAATRRITGRPTSDFIGKRDEEIWPPEVYQVYLPMLREALNTREIRSLETDLLLPGGGLRNLSITCVPLLDENNKAREVLGITRDFTERKRAEYELQASKKRLRELIDGLGQHIFVGLLTPEGTVIEANRPALAAAGLKPEDVLGQPVEQTYWFAYSKAVQQQLREAVDRAAAGTPSRYDVQVRAAEGVFIWLDFSLHPLRDETGKIVFIVPSGNVITERKRAEEMLRESESKYRLLIENADEGIFIVQDGVIKFPNPVTVRVTGYSVEELASTPFINLVHPEDREMVGETVKRRFQGEEVPARYSFRIRNKDGEVLWVQMSATMITWEGRPAVLDFVRDITEQKRLESQLFTAQKMETVGTLAGGIAHDFNNALTGIVGFGELLRMRVAGDKQALHDLDEIMRCAERAATLTRQLLTYARRQVIEPVNLSLNSLFAELMKLIGKVVGEHIEMNFVPAKNLPTVSADRGQIEQVFMNLCLNARDAMPKGGKLLVETRDEYLGEGYVKHHPYMKVGRYALLRVSDTGVGMDEKTRERVFEPFFTTKGPDKGTGLGLAMVYGIVKQHDGFIHLYSEPGKGTTFSVYFPAVEAQPDAVPEKRREEIVRGGTETILLAEDEEAIRSFIDRVLKELGYNVLVARNGEEAIEVFRQDKEIVLAVLDMVMPRKGGKEAFEEMYKENPRLKVIFMSGYAINGIHDSFVLIAGMPFLQKPFGPTILARKIRDVLDTQ